MPFLGTALEPLDFLGGRGYWIEGVVVKARVGVYIGSRALMAAERRGLCEGALARHLQQIEVDMMPV